ncbi:STRUBBELIG-RECEPTOR FAMILY 6 protein [Nymphaea thermarum]|nr:STRUBBELIG-RECEPTOR FAMILY 6 protein [Nymphaea thermarum]
MMKFVALFTYALLCNLASVRSDTDQSDVSALNTWYSILGSPSQLTGWSLSGGDPCGQSWTGVTCSGSAVTEIKLSGLGLSGSLGYSLDGLKSVINLDLNNNNLTGQIPYQLPPNCQQINLAGNGFTGDFQYSISLMTNLTYINLSHNQLQNMGDFFGKLTKLTELDLSFNNLSGNLPSTFSSLSSLTTLYLQNNQFTGSLDALTYLPLLNLNVANNHFSGAIPPQLLTIKNFQRDGNSWGISSPPGTDGGNSGPKSGDARGKKSGLSGGGVAGIVIAFLVFGTVVACFILRRRRSKSTFDEEKLNEDRPFSLLGSNEIRGNQIHASALEMKSTESSASTTPMKLEPSRSEVLKPPPINHYKSVENDHFPKRNITVKRIDMTSVNASVHSIADLQIATGSFSMDNLIGEGSFGRVYKAQFADGKVFAVKKVDSSSLPNQEPDDFMEVVFSISQLQHPNINELVGYCCEHSQYLLVYEFQENGSLHDYLHLVVDYTKPLTWNARVKIALGTARALEYLHEICSPSVIHKNLKSANILLDNDLNPHLSDCGLASLVPSTNHQVSHQHSCSGYSAPEVAMSGDYTLKSDVYSFGVVMLELMTGRMPFDSSMPRHEQSLVRWATPQLHDIDALTKMVDPALKELYPVKSLSRFADVIALCVQPEPEFRPPMSEVVQSLVTLVQRANMSKRTVGGENMGSHLVDDAES